MPKKNPALEKLQRRVQKNPRITQNRILRTRFDILQKTLGFEKTSGVIAEKLRDRLTFNFRTGKAIGSKDKLAPKRDVNLRIKAFAKKFKIPINVIKSVEKVNNQVEITITPRYAKKLNIDAGTYNLNTLKNTKLGTIFGNEITTGERVMKKTAGAFLKEQFKRSAKIKGSAANILLERYNTDKEFKQKTDDFTNAQRGRYYVWDKKLKKMVAKGEFKARSKIDKILVYIKSRKKGVGVGDDDDDAPFDISPTGNEKSSSYDPNPDDYILGGKYNKI